MEDETAQAPMDEVKKKNVPAQKDAQVPPLPLQPGDQDVVMGDETAPTLKDEAKKKKKHPAPRSSQKPPSSKQSTSQSSARQATAGVATRRTTRAASSQPEQHLSEGEELFDHT